MKAKKRVDNIKASITDRIGRVLRMSVVEFAERQKEFSEKTFGPGQRQKGIINHLRKELEELEAAPYDLEEWIDILVLGLDGAWRAGFTPYQIADMLEFKMSKNEGRTWPDWRTKSKDEPIEHDRSGEV